MELLVGSLKTKHLTLCTAKTSLWNILEGLHARD